MSTSYKQAGVDIEAGEALVDWLKKTEKTSSNVVAGVGGFAALFRANFQDMKKPLLVSCSDGVGTKILLATKYDRYEEVGQDLVAMSVNDLICTGGVPLFFQDYFACSKLDQNQIKAFLTGVRNACEASHCELIGGETAEMPGLYDSNHFDCAGFAVGVVDADHQLGPQNVKEGDQLIGVSSSGCHSNGYSLLRKVFESDMDQWIDELIKPTNLYVNLAIELQKQLKAVRAFAHITGGGMDNLLRVLPGGWGADIKMWEFSRLYQEIQLRTKMSTVEMLKTLNCGVGFIVVVSPDEAEKAKVLVAENSFTAYDLGVVDKSKSGWRIQ